MAYEPWVSSDEEIWGFSETDEILWYPDSSTSITWEFLGDFDACSALLGKINSGTLESTFINDDNKLILNEMNQTPGFCYLFYHFRVPNPSSNYFLFFRGTYGGSNNHNVEFQAFNYDTSSYTTFLILQSSTFTQDYYVDIPSGSEYFLGGTLKLRTIHNDPGNSGHLFRINYWRLIAGTAP